MKHFEIFQLDHFLVHSVLTRLEQVWDFSLLRFLFDCSHLGSVSNCQLKLPKKTSAEEEASLTRTREGQGFFYSANAKRIIESQQFM